MIRRIIIILAVTYIFYLIARLCFFAWVSHLKKKYKEPDESKTSQGGKTLKCKNCNSYVAEELSIDIKKEGDVLHFCSNECKDTFLRNQ
jgi:hypothetical protein